MRGRKPKWESRALEFYGRLASWKQMPESARLSLRALARQLGTSHQLLSHYLRGWPKWQAKQYRRRAKEIRSRAEIENRTLTLWEAQQARVYDQAASQVMIESVLDRCMMDLERDANVGRLKRVQVKMLKLLASRGWRKAQDILAKYTFDRTLKGNSSCAEEIREAIEGQHARQHSPVKIICQ